MKKTPTYPDMLRHTLLGGSAPQYMSVPFAVELWTSVLKSIQI